MPDLDGDGVPEVLAADRGFGFSDTVDRGPGRVMVISGATGDFLFDHIGGRATPFEYEFLGIRAASFGDVNGDGIGDYGASCNRGPARVWSGKDGSELYRTPNNSTVVAAIGDVTGDGLAEVIVVGNEVFDLATRTSLYRLVPSAPTRSFGWEMQSLGDVDSDGVPDLAVSAPDDAHNPFIEECHIGQVFVFSGRDGRELWKIPGVAPCDYLGYSLACPGDLNGDRIPDLAVGIPGPSIVGLQVGGEVAFHDGKSGALFGSFRETTSKNFAYRLEAAGDVNGNGFGDVLLRLTPPNGFRWEVWLVDGGTRQLLYKVLIQDPQTTFSERAWGGNFMGLPDLEDDGFPDLLIGSGGVLTSSVIVLDSLGRLDWFDGAPAGVRTLGRPCSSIPGVTPRIGITGSPTLGDSVDIHLTDVPVGQKALLVVGLSNTTWRGIPLPLDLGPLGIPGCDLLAAPQFAYFAEATPAGGDQAAATVRLELDAPPTLLGQPVYAQWILRSGRSGAVTRALELTLQ